MKSIGQSQLNSKTLAFVLPILERINTERQVQAVITAPTRELASQIYHQILKVTEHCCPDKAIMTRCYIGGTDKQRTIDKLKVQPHIVVGTPGRIKDLMIEQALFVHTSEVLVVDEADMMLDMGFIEDLDQVVQKCLRITNACIFGNNS
jgi:ATP-dependent RNA helicase CshB